MPALARFCVRRGKLVIGLWVLLLVAVAGIGKAFPAVYSNTISLPGSQSQKAGDLLKAGFPSQAGDHSQIVLKVDKGSISAPAVQKRVTPMLAKVAALPHVTGVVNPYSHQGKGQISKNGKIAFALLSFDEPGNTLPKAATKKAMTVAGEARGDGLQVELGGHAIEQAERKPPAATEAIGLSAAMIILLLTFGSVVAMGLPVLTALFGLGVGLSLLGILSHVLDTADFAPQLAAMVGLGVGIDYALFIVSRFRDAYVEKDGDLVESIVAAMDTAGRSVLFAGITVVIAILGMMLLGISFLYGVAIATSMVVLVTMLAAITLTPALLGFKRFGGRIGASRSKRGRGEKEGAIWARWADAVVKRRWLCAIGGTLVLVLLTIPAFGMRQLHNDAVNNSADQTTRKAYDLLAEGFGPGFNGPLDIVVKLKGPKQHSAIGEVSKTIQTTPGIVAVTPPRISKTGDLAVVTAYSATSPQSEATTNLVDHLRNDVTPKLAARTDTEILVSGFTPATVDLANIFSSKLPLFIGVVVLLSAMLLTLVFRSLLVPIKAAVMNLLSIGAALGVVTLVFQEGWGAGLLGIEPGPIEPFLPVMMFAIIFGLSMDYEVFIVSRIREEWTEHGDPRAAVRNGLAATGRVVTAAATIMVCVFAAFMFGGDKVIMMFGLGLATAVFLDAFLIRVILLPAVMDLAANATWWLPGWLDRLLPNVGIEGGRGNDKPESKDS